jgi:glycosyltransferase involved in cell wall biosynthesis
MALAEACVEILADPLEASSMALRAKQSAVERFSRAEHVRAITAIYGGLVEA